MRPNTSLDHNTIKALQELESILLLLNKLKTSEAKLKMLKSYLRYIKDERENSSFLWPFIRDKHTLSNENRQFDKLEG
ncbi:MAG: hypothetical protein FJ368_05560 [Pelagibacterales bacterium]|nr:hypothetical protein [Pelagibacterales bacterium]